jgi:hypothetical protein
MIRTAWLGGGLIALAATAQAQLAVRDSDHEARNAYQTTCQAFQKQVGQDNSVSCTPPALPPGKRLAIRFINVSCGENGSTRNHLIILSGGLEGEGLVANHFVPRRTTALGAPRFFLSEPVYLHTDRPPELRMHWEGDGSQTCFMTVFGYLVNKQ